MEGVLNIASHLTFLKRRTVHVDPSKMAVIVWSGSEVLFSKSTMLTCAEETAQNSEDSLLEPEIDRPLSLNWINHMRQSSCSSRTASFPFVKAFPNQHPTSLIFCFSAPPPLASSPPSYAHHSQSQLNGREQHCGLSVSGDLRRRSLLLVFQEDAQIACGGLREQTATVFRCVVPCPEQSVISPLGGHTPVSLAHASDRTPCPRTEVLVINATDIGLHGHCGHRRNSGRVFDISPS